MGNSESVPFALEERNLKYDQKPPVTAKLFDDHVDGNHSQLPPDLLHQVPANLINKVSLHRTVDLSFNLISNLPLDLPLSLPHLVHLNLSHNKLISLPESMFGFLHLEHLDISYNKIESLPAAICLLENLKKLNLSHNLLTTLPQSIDLLSNLQRLDISANRLEHLPLSLGNLPSLVVLLAKDNLLPHLGSEITRTSASLIAHLQASYSRSQSPDSTRSDDSSNPFVRVRGSVFDSRVLNSGSAQALFSQMQAQAVNTGNRIFTPMIHPVGATKLDAEQFRDAVVGMFYGALVGDSVGLRTEFMTEDQALFHYEGCDLGVEDLVIDKVRARYGRGDVSPSFHLVTITLESVVRWAGVVDELDYSTRLTDWYKIWGDNVSSPSLKSMLGASDFCPSTSAIAHCEEMDSYCLLPVIGLVVSQFYKLEEVTDNAARICRSTHYHDDNVKSSVKLASSLAQLLQGQSIEQALQELCDVDESRPASHPFTCLQKLVNAVDLFKKSGFKSALSKVVMEGGQATINGCVTGSVFGLAGGYSQIPRGWVEEVNKDIRAALDKRLNNLLDLMGLP